MHIDLIELFRCPRAHEESWLVASFDRMAGRHVVEGRLGCPVCRVEFPVERGVLRFDRGATAGGPPGAQGASPETARESPGGNATTPAGDEEALRLAALLGLADGGGVAVLSRSWSRTAAQIASMTEDIHLIVHDPGSLPAGEDTGWISAIVSPGRLPFAAASLRGVALDPSPAGPELLADAVRGLRPKGRLVVPTGTELPEGVAELARDESVSVAERRPAPLLLSLGRGRGSQGGA